MAEIEMFIPTRAEKFFVFYDSETEEIHGVSADEHEEFKNSARMSVSYDVGVKFLTGRLGLGQYRVQVSQETAKASLREVQINTKVIRLNSEGFIHIEHVPAHKKNTEIVLRYKKGSPLLRIEATPSLYKRLGVSKSSPTLMSGQTHAVFYISKWNDPSFYSNAVKISIDNLLRRGDITVDLGYEVTKSISIFTKKIFNSYSIKEIL